jgi:aminocarboxymuconate-semialdehyde decarboxylase
MIPAVDLHSHFWPRGFLDAMETGNEWFGWKKIDEVGTKTRLSLKDEILTFTIPKIDLADPVARSKKRIETQGVSLEAPMVVGFLWNYHLEGADSVKYCREVNKELSEVQHAQPENYHGLAMLPMQNKAAALEEIRFAVDQLGLTSFAIASHINGANLDEKDLLEIISAIASENLSLTIHPEFFNKIGDRDRLTRHYFKSSIGAPAESAIAMLSLIHSGIFDRYPDFRVSFTQGGGFAPYTIGRNKVRWDLDPIDKKPTLLSPEKYLRNCYVDCLVHDDDSLAFLLERMGTDRVMIGTDYPFDWDHPGGSANWIRKKENISQDVKKNVLWNNAAEFLNTNVVYKEL